MLWESGSVYWFGEEPKRGCGSPIFAAVADTSHCAGRMGRPPRRAGNGTRTRDPNLGKVVLYQLSYSRGGSDCSAWPAATQRSVIRLCTPEGGHGGEGDRTPDLVNAIHALSQLSYAPTILSRPRTAPRQARKRSPCKTECQRGNVAVNGQLAPDRRVILQR
jgi:hypothetical protein